MTASGKTDFTTGMRDETGDVFRHPQSECCELAMAGTIQNRHR